MGELLLALTALVAGHAIPSAPLIRPALVARLGRAGFGAAYGLASVALLLWVIVAYRAATPVWLWVPPFDLRWVSVFAMPVALWLVIAGAMAPREASPRGIYRVVVAPFSAGLSLWAGLHLLSVGEARGVALFAAFLLIGLIALVKNWLIAPPALRAVGPLPFASLLIGRQRFRLAEFSLWPVAAALALWLALLWLDRLVIGVDPAAGLVF